MAVGYLLSTPESLICKIPSVLDGNGIPYEKTDSWTVERGRRTTDLTVFECRAETGTVDLCIEKRRGREGADIVLAPSRKLFFWPDRSADALAERLVKILCEHGADDEP